MCGALGASRQGLTTRAETVLLFSSARRCVGSRGSVCARRCPGHVACPCSPAPRADGIVDGLFRLQHARFPPFAASRPVASLEVVPEHAEPQFSATWVDNPGALATGRSEQVRGALRRFTTFRRKRCATRRLPRGLRVALPACSSLTRLPSRASALSSTPQRMTRSPTCIRRAAWAAGRPGGPGGAAPSPRSRTRVPRPPGERGAARAARLRCDTRLAVCQSPLLCFFLPSQAQHGPRYAPADVVCSRVLRHHTAPGGEAQAEHVRCTLTSLSWLSLTHAASCVHVARSAP